MKRAGVIMATALLAAAVVGLPGCKVDQAWEVSLYREVVDLPLPGPRGDALSLQDALLLANRHNETLAVEGEGYLRAIIQRRRTAAAFLPTADVVGTWLHRDPVAGSGSGTGSQSDALDVTADLNLNIFNGLRDVNRYWRDTFLIEQRRSDLLAFQEALLLDVVRVYYQVMRSESAVRVLENSLVVQEERLRDARGRLEAGVARPLDVAQTEAQASTTRTILIDARRDAATARTLLELLTGAAVGEARLTDGYAPPPVFEPLEDYLATAGASRRELAAALAAVDVARREVEVAWGQYYPTVSLNLNAYLYRETVPTARDWDSLLAVNIPIFRGGQIHADVRTAWSFVREAMLVRSYLRRRVAQEVGQVHIEAAAAQARLKELHVRVSAAEQAVRQSEGSYAAGLGTNLERVAAQDTLLEAQLLLVSAEYDLKEVALTLHRVVGTLREQLEAMAAPDAGQAAPAANP